MWKKDFSLKYVLAETMNACVRTLDRRMDTKISGRVRERGRGSVCLRVCVIRSGVEYQQLPYVCEREIEIVYLCWLSLSLPYRWGISACDWKTLDRERVRGLLSPSCERVFVCVCVDTSVCLKRVPMYFERYRQTVSLLAKFYRNLVTKN